MFEFGEEKSKALSFLDGTFINTPVILNAQDISGQDIFNNGNPIDCGVKMTLDIGMQFQPEWKVFGNFKEKNGKMDWGSAFVVREFLGHLIKEGKLNDNGSIPQEICDQLVGKRFIRLSYVRGFDESKGKRRYGDYKFTAVVDDYDNPEQIAKAGKKLTERFIKDVQAGWVKDFDPDAGKKDETSFP